ncbi:MAG: aldehyde dehydrogenase [Nevskiaceae bacterium]|nr:MAG: aldehyde dehydrogenase [Nevskiaceae bacterium]TBR71426.1 MAG: aldehyde dehydrogenase [Nevskiaceae bacterium]
MNTHALRFEHYVNGRFIADTAATIEVRNPADETVLGQVPDGDVALAEQAIAAARAAQDGWAARPAIERGQFLHRMATGIRNNAEPLARTIVLEQGKLLPLAQMEVGVTAEYLDYMAEWARRIEGEVITSDRPGENIFLFHRPLGVTVGILPWNFPLFMVARKVAPALVTGNTAVIKPSEETPYSACAFARIAAEAELPAGVLNIICGRGRTLGAALVGNPAVDMVSFTGSSAAGSAIMANAARNTTKVSLELGGKAPSIVLADANLDQVAGILRASKALNSGQACNCTERLYVERSVCEALAEKLANAFNSVSVGNPLGATPVEMGPLINRTAVDRIQSLVDDARQQGADVLAGGSGSAAGQGYYFAPTVVSGTKPGMKILEREVFGPVVMIDPVDSLEEAIALANANEYGLTSSIFTNNLTSAMRAINQLKYGEVYVNRENFEAIQGHHAGVRRSGIGGDDGKHGLYEYMHTQVAYIQS